MKDGKYTRQEIFDLTWQRFIVDKKPFGYDKKLNTCVYRDSKKATGIKRCAIGALIPNSLYRPAIEGKAFTTAIHEDPNLAALFYPADYELLNTLQIRHDNAARNEDRSWFEKALRTVAEEFGVSIPKAEAQ